MSLLASPALFDGQRSMQSQNSSSHDAEWNPEGLPPGVPGPCPPSSQPHPGSVPPPNRNPIPPRRVDHTYRDYSNYPASELPPQKKGPTNFPSKLHQILSTPEYSHILCWMPHGRAWKIHNKELLIRDVVPKYFVQSKYESFTRQLNGWGFKRLHQAGNDFNAYYHEAFLRGLPHLTVLMKRVSPNQGKQIPHAEGEPNFYEINKQFPIPAETAMPYYGQYPHYPPPSYGPGYGYPYGYGGPPMEPPPHHYPPYPGSYTAPPYFGHHSDPNEARAHASQPQPQPSYPPPPPYSYPTQYSYPPHEQYPHHPQYPTEYEGKADSQPAPAAHYFAGSDASHWPPGHIPPHMEMSTSSASIRGADRKDATILTKGQHSPPVPENQYPNHPKHPTESEKTGDGLLAASEKGEGADHGEAGGPVEERSKDDCFEPIGIFKSEDSMAGSNEE